MKKILSLICLVALLLCCASALAEENKDPLMDYDNQWMKHLAGKRIAVANIYLGDEWCKLLADSLVEYGKIYGFEVNSQDGNLDHDTQCRQIENFITQQYDMILVDPANGEGINSRGSGIMRRNAQGASAGTNMACMCCCTAMSP